VTPIERYLIIPYFKNSFFRALVPLKEKEEAEGFRREGLGRSRD